MSVAVKSIQTTRLIEAPIKPVFDIIANPQLFCTAISHITKVEFLTDKHEGVGTRFRETRLFNGREQATELEITEFVDAERVRMVADAGGTIWDTLFTFKISGESTQLNMQMDVRPHTFLARFITPLIRGTVVKGIEADMDAVKQHCEASDK